MDDLLDLNWVDSTSKQDKSSPSVTRGEPRDAFAGLLSTSSKKTVDVTKLSLFERQRLQQQQNSLVSSNTTPNSATMPHNNKTLLPSSTTPIVATSSPVSLNNNKSSISRIQDNTSGSSKKESSFDNLLDPFPLSSNKNQTQDRNTPLNQLRSVSTPDSNIGDTWDFDLLDSKLTSTPFSTATNNTATPTSITDPFDVQTLVESAAFSQRHALDQDDNPLGILAQPAITSHQQLQGEMEPEAQFEEAEPIQHSLPENTIKPSEEEEDKKLAHLIEMGFSLRQSKFAIEATVGQDVQAAVDLLVQNSEIAQRLQPSSIPSRSENRHPVSQNESARNALFSDESPTQSRRRRDVEERPTNINDDNTQLQTEKLVTHAQELGGFLYKNAASYLKAGRDRVTKAVGDWQEQQRTQRLEEQKGPIRPKWMTGGDDIVDVSAGSVESFRDDEDEGDIDNSMAEKHRIERQQRLKQQEAAAAAHKLRQQQQLKKDLLFDDDQTTYVSPSRRRAATPKSGRSMSPALPKGSPIQNATRTPVIHEQAPQVVSTKVNSRTRPVVSASPETLIKASKSRSLGNERFKIGQFGEAEEAYSYAINALPSGHDLHVLLYNNRAATRLKTGDYKKCIEDCDLVFDLCNQSGDESVVIDDVTIRFRDQLVKSLYRKAEALEHIEKYNEALSMYDILVKYEGTANLNINQRMSRCRQALNPKKSAPKPKNTSSQTLQSQKPKDLMAMFDPAAPTIATVSEEELSKSKAVAAMRAKAAEKEAEDAEKLQKVDDVNARILAWKSGKEQNLRALLATLDSLLWPGAQWKGAQMSELINPKKCKITYMKAISKVHPDKLPSDTTVEHRMLASAIFSTLNEAWDSFKGQNQL